MGSPRSVKVGVSASLSGQFRTQGRQALTGLRAWVEDVNRAGGMAVGDPGSPIPVSLVFYDDASRAEAARQAVERLIDEDGVDLLIGPYSSVLAQAAAAVAESREVVLWNQGGASDSIYDKGYRWVVGILTPASEYLAGLPGLVRETAPEADTLGIVQASSGAFPSVVSFGVEQEALRLGFRLVLRRGYDPATSDFSEILDAVEQARPDVLLAVGRIQNDLELARQMVRRPMALGVAAVVATPIQQFQDALGAQVEGFLGPSQWEPSGEYPNDYGPDTAQVLASLGRHGYASVDYPMVQAYAAGLVAQRCVETSGSLDQCVLREVAGVLDFSTFYGRFSIDPDTGRQTGRSVVIVQWQQDRKVIVWPPEQRRARLVYPWR